jgi:hypothetical protein
VTVGFDGARFRDATAMVLTDVHTGVQQVHALWERPPEIDGVDLEWEVDPGEVTAAVDKVMHGTGCSGSTATRPTTSSRWPMGGQVPGVVEEWWTQRKTAMAYAIRTTSRASGPGVKLARDPRPATGSPVENETLGEALVRHIGNAGRK